MATDIQQNFNLLAAVPNFTRDSVDELPVNSVARTQYELGHIVYLNKNLNYDGHPFNEGSYYWTGGTSDDSYDGWKYLIDKTGSFSTGDILYEYNTVNDIPAVSKNNTLYWVYDTQSMYYRHNNILTLLFSLPRSVDDIEIIQGEIFKVRH